MGDNRFKIKNGLLVEAGGTEITGSLVAPSITGSLLGTASLATTASFAFTASFLSGEVVSASYARSASYAIVNESQYRFELVTTIDQDLWLFPATITRVVKSPGVDTAQYRTGSAEAFNTITFTGNESTTPIAVKVNDEFSWRITYNSGYTTAALTVVSQRN